MVLAFGLMGEWEEESLDNHNCGLERSAFSGGRILDSGNVRKLVKGSSLFCGSLPKGFQQERGRWTERKELSENVTFKYT